MLDELLSGFARAYDDLGYFLIAIWIGPPLMILAIAARTNSLMRGFVNRFEEMFPGTAIIAGDAAEVTDDDRVGEVVQLRSGWLQTTAVIVLADRLEVWSKDAEAADIVLDRSRLEVSREGIWIRYQGGDGFSAGLWLTDGDQSVIIIPHGRSARSARRALVQALRDLGESPKDHLDAV